VNASAFDIAVIGGGAAGVSAAVAAAKNGSSVLLIDRNHLTGGLASNAQVGTICGLYRGDVPGFELKVGKFAREFSIALQEKSGRAPLQNSLGLKYLPFSSLDFAVLCREVLEEAEVHCVHGEFIRAAQTGAIIDGVEWMENDVLHLAKVGAVIDASGVSQVSRQLGLAMLDWEFRQSVSQVFTLKNVAFNNEENFGLIVLKALHKGVLCGALEARDLHCSLVPGSLGDAKVSMKISVPASGIGEQEAEQLRQDCLHSIDRIVGYLNLHETAFAQLEVDSVAPSLGVRVNERAPGKSILRDADVLEARKSTEYIAHGNWPIEIWGASTRVEIQPLPKADFYDIPMDCLRSASVENLYFAGRCIAATDRAIASARVIGTCLQTGYAAGMYAALRAKDVAHEAAIRRIQKEQFEA
jgi:hypothetical protein